MQRSVGEVTQAFPCSLVVYQFYRQRGLDASFMQLFKSMLSRSENDEHVDLPDHLTHRIHVPVSRHQAIRNKESLSNKAAIDMNQLLELYIRDLIRDAFLEEMDACRRTDSKLRIKEFIDSVLIRYGLGEEAKTFDAVKKDLQRFCKSENIEYRALKKVRKPVPKITTKCANCASDGIPLEQYLEYKGISRRSFFRKYKRRLKTFVYKKKLYVHLDSIPSSHVSFATRY